MKLVNGNRHLQIPSITGLSYSARERKGLAFQLPVRLVHELASETILGHLSDAVQHDKHTSGPKMKTIIRVNPVFNPITIPRLIVIGGASNVPVDDEETFLPTHRTIYRSMLFTWMVKETEEMLQMSGKKSLASV
ncbi:hypothetical protein CBL_14599 [Carabus blaptoides fortunei]